MEMKNVLKTRQDLAKWYSIAFSGQKEAAKLTTAYREAYAEVTGDSCIRLSGVTQDFAEDLIRNAKKVFWWFTNFVVSCKEAPARVVAAVASEDKIYSGTDRYIFEQWVVAMNGFENKAMRYAPCLSRQEIQKESAPFVAAARALLKLGLIDQS